MRKQNRSPRQSEPAVRGSKKKEGKQPIRQLTVSDDLGVLFSSGREDGLPNVTDHGETPQRSNNHGTSGHRVPQVAAPCDRLLPNSFADALASGIPAATLAEILTEKEELPPPAQSRPGATRKSPPPQEQLDLHGCTAAEAEAKTTSFLTQARRNHLKTVLVITGKGIHSPEGPVLKDVIEALLQSMKNDGSILAWLWEKKTREESGALLVYLP